MYCGAQKIESKQCNHPLLHVNHLLSCVFIGSDVGIFSSILLSIVLLALLVKHICYLHGSDTNQLELVFLNLHS